MLVLAAICALPAISAAQDSGTGTAPSATTPADPLPPSTDPATPAPPSTVREPSTGGPDGGPAAPGEAAEDTRTADTAVADSPPPAGPPGGGAHKSANASVTMGDFFFSPSSVTVAIGDTVTWHNNGQAPHNATADNGSFSTPDLNNGGSASHRFNSAGTFSYICTIHPQMTGTVRVLSSSSGGKSGGSAGSSSSGSGISESSAVASPDAAGTSSTLPMSGLAAGAMALVGIALLAAGLIARRASRVRASSFLTIF